MESVCDRNMRILLQPFAYLWWIMICECKRNEVKLQKQNCTKHDASTIPHHLLITIFNFLSLLFFFLFAAAAAISAPHHKNSNNTPPPIKWNMKQPSSSSCTRWEFTRHWPSKDKENVATMQNGAVNAATAYKVPRVVTPCTPHAVRYGKSTAMHSSQNIRQGSQTQK